jgi:hypothetical protein
MANLIIKPTSGGSLILQDEGGTAAHTIDASGNHTLSGTTNNIGTATAGTLSSGVTFPTGHTIQTKFAQVAVAIAAITTSGDNTEVHSGLRIDFTPVASTSKIIFTFHAGNAIAQSADLLVSIRYHTTTNTAPNTDFGNNYTSGDRQGATAQVFTFDHMHFENSWSGLRCVSPCYGSSNGNSVCISNSTHVTFFRIDEIAQ